jgi:hypothetical protein
VELAYPPTGVICRISAGLGHEEASMFSPPQPVMPGEDRSWDAANRRRSERKGLEPPRFA